MGDVIGTAIKVAKIDTGEVEGETIAGKEYAQKGGLKGSRVRAEKLSQERRSEIAQRAASVRWKK